MGLLDDAIREHLELKRKHGAPEAEVDQLADEVFGDARAPAPADAAEPEPDAGAPDDEHEPEEELAEDAGFTYAPPLDPQPPPSVPDEPLPPRKGDDDDDEFPEEDLVEDAGFDRPPPAEAAGPPAFTATEPWLDEPDEVPAGEALDHRPPPTEEHPAPSGGEYVEPDEGPEGEDVLEETPDFLQETPEHERLWFEQKPPRGFDFGGD
jgi:hypothetical protein